MVELEKRTGSGISLNTSLNRRCDAIFSAQKDPLDMFYSTCLQYLMIEYIVVVKGGRGENV